MILNFPFFNDFQFPHIQMFQFKLCQLDVHVGRTKKIILCGSINFGGRADVFTRSYFLRSQCNTWAYFLVKTIKKKQTNGPGQKLDETKDGRVA
jgi:hypothetical protein